MQSKPDSGNAPDVASDTARDTGSDTGAPDAGVRSFGGHRIAAGRTRTCAVRAGGRVACWGGIGGEIRRPIMVEDLADVVSVHGGSDDRMCAVTSSGAVKCWADAMAPAAVTDLAAGVREVAMGDGFACALRATGEVLCWGKNGSGQLGDGTQIDRAGPATVPDLAGVAQLGAGEAHVCALTKAGTVSCWGDNGHWQLGDGTSIGRFAPVPVAGLGTDIEQIAVGPHHGCARAKAGTVSCWGFNASGQSSASGALFLTAATPFDALSSMVHIVAGGAYEFGTYDHSLTCTRASDGSIWCAGRGVNGELGDGVLGREGTDVPLRLSSLGTATVDLAIGGQHVCSIDDRDQVWCWGRNYSGQLGRDTPASPVPLKLTAFGPFSTFDVGEDSTCGQASTGFYCWGSNAGGQLGISEPVALAPRFVAGAPTDVKQWGTGDLFTCWLRTTGQVVCSGGRAGRQPTEMKTLGTDNAQLSVGNKHACVLKRDGSLWCWGNTTCGFVPNELDPVSMTAFTAPNINVFTGVGVTCVQRPDGSVWCCGDGWGMAPIQAPVGTDAVEVALSVNGCARKASGAILCGPSLRQVQPIALDGAVQLALSHDAACARKADGSVWCWGKNTRGVMGTGTGDNAQPVRVASATPFVDIAGGDQHFCARDSTGRLYCWGDNYLGQLGDGLGGDRGIPALVQFP